MSVSVRTPRRTYRFGFAPVGTCEEASDVPETREGISQELLDFMGSVTFLVTGVDVSEAGAFMGVKRSGLATKLWKQALPPLLERNGQGD